jgi:hypothetical protein
MLGELTLTTTYDLPSFFLKHSDDEFNHEKRRLEMEISKKDNEICDLNYDLQEKEKQLNSTSMFLALKKCKFWGRFYFFYLIRRITVGKLETETGRSAQLSRCKQ